MREYKVTFVTKQGIHDFDITTASSKKHAERIIREVYDIETIVKTEAL